MRVKFLPVIFVLMAFIAVGCAHYPAGLASSASPMEQGEMEVLGHATGSVGYFSLFGFIPFGKPDYDAAISNAVRTFPQGEKLINVRSWFTQTFVIVGTLNTLNVEGDVVK